MVPIVLTATAVLLLASPILFVVAAVLDLATGPRRRRWLRLLAMGMSYLAAAVDPEIGQQWRDGALGFGELYEILDAGVHLDKMWNAAQIMLGGSLEAVEPLMTGSPIGEDLGYGPPMFATPDDVRRVAGTLDAFSYEGLSEAFDPGEMVRQHAYPSVWNEPRELLAAPRCARPTDARYHRYQK